VVLLFCGTGCVQYGNLEYCPLVITDVFTLAGSIVLREPVETDLLSSYRYSDIASMTDYSKFVVSVPQKGTNANKDGTFSLTKILASEPMLLSATAGKIVLKRRLYPRDFKYTDMTKLIIDVETTARALIWEKAKETGVELTEADILAREYESLVASVSQAIRFALLLPKKDVPKTILDLDMVTKPVSAAAKAIQAREIVLTEACSVLANALLKENAKIFEHYLSPDFGNDWDASSTYNDFLTTTAGYFKNYDFRIASYSILQMEFIPGNLARVRSAGEVFYTGYPSGIMGQTRIYISDVIWRKEGSFWKILRNLPYKPEHPTQINANASWRENKKANFELQKAFFGMKN